MEQPEIPGRPQVRLRYVIFPHTQKQLIYFNLELPLAMTAVIKSERFFYIALLL